jgi:hypothetical protein
MRQFLEIAIDAVKYARWLTRERLLFWGIVCASLSIVLLTYDVVAHPMAGPDMGDHDLGKDFINYWSGGLLAARGQPETAYDFLAYHSYLYPFFGSASRSKIYSYPPIMMLLCRPLADLSYLDAFVLWICFGMALCAWSLSRLVDWPMAALATVGTPAAFMNLLSGQNGYFTAALLIWGITLVDRRPVAAGILLGMLCYKPQMGILLPLALVAGGYWRVVAAAAACVILLVAASVIELGPDSWIGFFDRMVMEHQLLQFGSGAWPRMPTVFVLMRMVGAGLPTAYLVQGISTISAAAAVVALWRGGNPLSIKSAGLVVGVFLVTPYAWYYDMVVLVFASAWLANEASKAGFLPWEKICAFALLTLPGLSILPARLLGLQIGPILLWLTMAVILRHGFAYPSRSLFPIASSQVADVNPAKAEAQGYG